MNFFKKSIESGSQTSNFITRHIKLIGIALILSVTVLLSIFAIGRLANTPQSEPQGAELTQAAITENPVIDNPIVNREDISRESSLTPPLKPTAESIIAAEQSSKPISAAVNKNPFLAKLPDASRESLFNQPAKPVIPATGGNEDQTELVALEENDGLLRVSDTVRQEQSAAQSSSDKNEVTLTPRTKSQKDTRPKELRMKRAHPFEGDVRSLPRTPAKEKVRFKHQKVVPNPTFFGRAATEAEESEASAKSSISPEMSAPAPPPINTFDGLARTPWGAGFPPDPSGDVGPNHYIQAINTSIGIYDKTSGAELAAFTFDTFMSQGNFGNLCDTDNFGDPIILYDTFEDRWIITDFAFQLDGGGNVVHPPGAFQCFAVSKTSDPVSGGWNFYSIQRNDGLNDYPKFGVWSDGIYMSANMFGFPAGGGYQGSVVWAFNKAQMYAGSPTVQIVSFNVGTGDFTLMPSNARLQTGTPPPGTPNYFLSTWNFLNALTVYKFNVNWNQISLSTFTGPEIPLASTSWPNAGVANAPTGGTALDTIQIRAMMQNNYSNIGGVESLWMPHTVRRLNTTGAAAPRWYQVDVTGGTVAPAIPQAMTWDPDGNNTTHRYVPSLAVDRMGNMAMGYTASGTGVHPSIRYAGRLATDPINTFSQTEQTMFAGTGSQTGTARWGDYTHMTLDPDGCTFWYTNEYYVTTGTQYRTRIGSFKYAECATIGNGILDGTVTVSGNPLEGATVSLGSRTAMTDINGYYLFTDLPAGTYPNATASKPGFGSSSVNSIVINEFATTTQNFSLSAALTTACLTDTTQADFQTDIATNTDLTTSPGDVTLAAPLNVNQQNTTLGNSGVGITVTTWGGQTFTPSVTAALEKLDVNLFCSGCTGTTPNLTVSIRNTAGGLPTGADLASATITGFSSGASAYYTATFATPPVLTAGTQYAFVIRPTVNPAPGTYALTRSGTATAGANVYPGGTRITGATSGTVWSIPLTGGVSTDAGFRIYLNTGYSASGEFVSSIKDANPTSGSTPLWGTISWNATTPADTDIQFQVAASNNPNGPFNFVGPDGTPATFFSNGASLSQFDGFRYLRYKAILSTTDGAVTPTLHDVTICFNNVINTTLNVDPASGTFGGTVNLSATLTDGANGISGKSIDFTLNAVSVGSAMTDANGVATLSNVSLVGINANIYPTGVGASFAGDANYGTSAGTNSLTVNKADQIIMFGALADKLTTDPPFMVSATGGASGNPVTFSASGNCTSGGTNGSTITITGAGSCTVTASQLGNSNYNDATPVMQSFNIFAPNTPPTANPDSYSTTQDTPLNVPPPGVLGNDSDPDAGNTITAVLVTGPTNAASFALNADGSFNYTPTAGFTGTDSFTYHARDNLNADSNTVTVTINVQFKFNWFSYGGVLFSPTTLNQVTAGSDVPVRFTLYGYKGNPYSSPPTSEPISCVTFLPTGAATVINRYAPDPMYYSTFDFYQTTWKTQASWKFTCRKLTLYLTDGTTKSLNFYFK